MKTTRPKYTKYKLGQMGKTLQPKSIWGVLKFWGRDFINSITITDKKAKVLFDFIRSFSPFPSFFFLLFPFSYGFSTIVEAGARWTIPV